MRCKLIFLIPLLLFVRTSAGQSTLHQWLIESIEGVWEIQEEGKLPRKMTGKYEVLTSNSKIRCVDAANAVVANTFSKGKAKSSKPAEPLQCYLKYSTGSGELVDLPVTPKLNEWIEMSGVQSPEGPPVLPTSSEIAIREGRLAGRTKDSSICGGTFPLSVPLCGETLDIHDLQIRWSPVPSESGKMLSLFVDPLDGPRGPRFNSIPVDASRTMDSRLQEYLASLQRDEPLEVALRLTRSQTFFASRVIRLPSKKQDNDYHQALRAANSLPPLARNLRVLDETLRIGMWSKAADVADELTRDAPQSIEIVKFALVAFCSARRSDRADEVLRTLDGPQRSCEQVMENTRK